jgi:serine/threonine protein kinase
MAHNQGRLKKGSLLGAYKIVRLIGQGGMGEVYEGRDEILDRKVALKVILPEHYHTPEVEKRFRIEGQALAKLNHQNVVTVHALGEDKGNNYLVMEYVDGVPLWDLLKAKTYLQPPEAVHYFYQLLAGVQALHANGIIHRDIKPKNIIIRKDNSVKIVDFGIAKVKGHPEREITATGAMVGSLYYLAPEVIDGQTASVQSDIWSLGINFYEMLTGQKPFQDQSRAELVRKITKADISFPAERKISDSFRSLILRMCEKSPERRFASVEEILLELDANPVIRSAQPRPALPTVAPAVLPKLDKTITIERQVTPLPLGKPVVLTHPRRNSSSSRSIVALGLATLVLAGIVYRGKLNTAIQSLRTLAESQRVFTPSSPAAEQMIWMKDAKSLEFSWAGTSGAEIFLQLAKDPEFRDVILEAANPASPYIPQAPTLPEFEDRNYFWRLVRKDGATTEPLFESVRFQVLTLAPPQPSWPIDQATSVVDKSMLFSWLQKSADVSYQFQLARDGDFQQLFSSQKTRDVQVTVSALPEGVYFWRVRAENDNGSTRWSQARTLTLKKPEVQAPVSVPAPVPVVAPPVVQPPLAMPAPKNSPIVPTILPPKKEKRTEPAKTFTVKPAKVQKPVVVTPAPHKTKARPAPVKAVAKKANPAPPRAPAPAAAKTAEVSVKPLAPPKAAVAEPQIQRKPVSIPTPIENLKIPKLKLPPNGVSIVLLNGILSPISFKWESITDADSYHFEISKDAQFTKIIESQDSKNNQLTISKSFSAGKFYWRLRSEKGTAKSKWSETYTFEITD